MKKPNAYIIYRVLLRIHEQGDKAFICGRKEDAADLWKLIGRLEFLHFQAVSLEREIEKAA